MMGAGRSDPVRHAHAMLEAFASVGADSFDLSITTRNGARAKFRRGVPLENLRRSMPAELAAATQMEHNVIVRPRAFDTVFVQLDDLSPAGIECVRPAAFLVLETSPRNHQAWVAMRQADDEFIRRLRKGAGADPSASGAARIAGSFNFKDKYAPNFPRVEIVYCAAGMTANQDRLAQLGLLAKEGQRPGPRHSKDDPIRRRWPNYRRCIDGAPPTHDGTHQDISRADFTWCLIAIDWGWSIEETAARLMEESPKARKNGTRYAQLTAQRAAHAAERRKAPHSTMQ